MNKKESKVVDNNNISMVFFCRIFRSGVERCEFYCEFYRRWREFYRRWRVTDT